jgi:hypothetical protein
MTNAFGVVLDDASARWAAAESVSETVIAAVLLLHDQSVSEIASKLNASELEHVIRRAVRWAPLTASPLATHLALHAFVEARHTDDHALMDAAADRLDLVARFHAERDCAAFHA